MNLRRRNRWPFRVGGSNNSSEEVLGIVGEDSLLPVSRHVSKPASSPVLPIITRHRNG